MPTFEEILAEAEASVARNKARTKPGKSPVERTEDPARDNLYIPHRNVYNWFQNRCACGREWFEFDGIYEERRHPRLAHLHWVRLPAIPTNSLPTGKETKLVETPYCEECIHYAETPTTEPKPEAPRIASS